MTNASPSRSRAGEKGYWRGPIGSLAAAVAALTHIFIPVLVVGTYTDLSSWSGWSSNIILTAIGGVGLVLTAALVCAGPGYATYLLLIGAEEFVLKYSPYLYVWARRGVYAAAVVLAVSWTNSVWGGIFPVLEAATARVRPAGASPGIWALVTFPMLYFSKKMLLDVEAMSRTLASERVEDSTDKKPARVSSQPAATGTSAEEDEIHDAQKQTTSVNLNELQYPWESPPAVRFRAVGGKEDVKHDLRRSVINPLTSTSDAYARFDVNPPRGVLFHGPPGTGKSHIARALAGEIECSFVELTGADITSKWINESPQRVRDLFREAEEFEFAVMFIDEIDALLQDRRSSGHTEDAKVVNEFLSALAKDDAQYLVIAATNQRDQLDEAALRSGRFDQQYEIGLPDAEERAAIFSVQLRNRSPALSPDDYRDLAGRTRGYTAADITGVVQAAALEAAERDAEAICHRDVVAALQ